MKKIFIIIKREYLVRVRTKAFLIGTIISPVLMLALIVLPGFLATRGGGERRITVIDQSSDPGLFEAMRRRTESPDQSAGGRDRPSAQFVLTHRPILAGEDINKVIEDCRVEAGKHSDTGCLVLRAGVLDDVPNNAPVEYYAANVSDFSIGSLRQSISSAISEQRVLRHTSPELIGTLMKDLTPVEMTTFKVGAGGETRAGGSGDFFVAFGLLLFMYMTTLIYGLFVMRGVIEEKQSRIVEVIVSSVKPMQMMLGKVIGIGLMGLTQIGIWALTLVVISVFGVSFFAARGIPIPSISINVVIYFVVFFLLGYFLYATLYALVGSIVSTEEEAQQAQLPVTLLVIVPMMIFGMILSNPNSSSSIALSMVPFFAPTLMMLRIAVVNLPFWQIGLSIVIMLATTLFFIWVAARIYRVGILMYGKKPSIAELGRWLRYS
jgi:ABC-2 type transport system permease protein